jgi:hypothetical protein
MRLLNQRGKASYGGPADDEEDIVFAAWMHVEAGFVTAHRRFVPFAVCSIAANRRLSEFFVRHSEF